MCLLSLPKAQRYSSKVVVREKDRKTMESCKK